MANATSPCTMIGETTSLRMPGMAAATPAWVGSIITSTSVGWWAFTRPVRSAGRKIAASTLLSRTSASAAARLSAGCRSKMSMESRMETTWLPNAPVSSFSTATGKTSPSPDFIIC